VVSSICDDPAVDYVLNPKCCENPAVDFVLHPECIPPPPEPTPEPEPKPVPAEAPKFANFLLSDLGKDDPLIVQAGTVKVIKLPDLSYQTAIYTVDDIKVQIQTINPVDEDWITFNKIKWQIEFEPNNESSKSAQLKLLVKNIKTNLQTEYNVYIKVEAAETKEEDVKFEWDWLEGAADEA